MAIRKLTRSVNPLQTRAAVGSVDEKTRTVEMTFSTGARVYRQGWFDEGSFEELSMSPEHVRMDRLNSGNAPFLADHYGSTSNVLGVIESARLEGGTGYAKVRFPSPGTDERADQVFEKIRQGILKNVSVGYRVHRAEKVGKAPRSEGGDELPVYRATDWEPYEVSAVAIPADAAATFRSDDPKQCNPCVFVTRQEETEVDEEQKKQAELEAQKAEQAKRDLELKAKQAERERIAGIQHAARALGSRGVELAKQHTAGDTSLDAFRKIVIDELAKRGDETAIQSNVGSGIEVGESDREKMIRGMTAGLLTRSGAMHVIAGVVAGVKSGQILTPGVRAEFAGFNADDSGGEYRGLTALDMARETLERRGRNVRGLNRDSLLNEAFSYRSGGEATISDFAVVLENVMYKTLLGAYATADDTWRAFCGTDSVQDFRPSNRYRTGSFGSLDTLSEAGEYKHKAIPDGLKFSVTTETRGNKIAVSRQAIINDDMGAIADTMNKFGRMAGLSIEKDVYALLNSGSGLGPNITLGGTTAALFDDTAWKNVASHTVLGMAGLEADRVKLAQQKDISNNEYLNLRPSVLLVHLSQEGEANLINRAKYDPTASSAFERPNIVGGLFQRVVGSPRLTDTSRRYLFVSPSEVAAIKVVFLNGAQAPFMDQRLGWDTDGMEMKLRHDFKVQAFDPKGAVTNAGTA